MNDDLLPPVLILGSERSGTNLLRALLSSHSKIISPPPAGFIDALGEIQLHYSRIDRTPALTQFLNDVITLTTTHHNPWDIALNSDEIKARLNNISLWDIFRVVNEIYAEQYHFPCWCSKEPGLFRFIPEIANHLPGAKFIYLVRDGRDVAVSMLQGHVHAFHVYDAAKIWSWTQKLCLNALASPSLKDRIYLMKYESLIDDPKHAMGEIMQFIGFDFEDTQLQFYKNQDVVNHSMKSRFWKNLADPINNDNKGKYKNNLGLKEIEIFESVAWDEMEMLGYTLSSSQRKNFSKTEIHYYRFLAEIRKKFWSLDPRKEASRNRTRVKITQNIIKKYIKNFENI